MPLFVVATPIGNLDDITSRARETLANADLILCEDTRVTSKLLARYDIKKPLRAFHQHSSDRVASDIIAWLRHGAAIALVTDAGTPGISDPGNQLVARVARECGDTVDVIPIPGPSALTALASVAGIPMERFLFLGFLPHKKGRQTMIRQIGESDVPVVVYESPHRILKLLDASNQVMPGAHVVVGKELTKMFEKTYRGPIGEVADAIRTDGARGEYVVIFHKNKTLG
ncbi:MAG: 16S rRNA (cytidine(1402)-2'-O)-methyltransferase [Patescibacteria group bacterium]